MTMAASLTMLGLAAMLLPGCASADHVTTQRCKVDGRLDRVRHYPIDKEAMWLNLYRCNLTELNPNDLNGLPNLENIHLKNNSISHLDPTTFCSVPSLMIIDLSYNKLSEIVFDIHSCDNLRELSLRSNHLTKITKTSFSACQKLQLLVLAHNNLDHIHPDVFKPLTDLSDLILDDNKITLIPNQMFIKNTQLERLSLVNNRISYLPVDFVSNLRRVGVRLVRFYFHENPLQCSCLRELLTDVKRAGVTYYDKIQSECDSVMEECRRE